MKKSPVVLSRFVEFHNARRTILTFFENWEEKTRRHARDRALAEAKLAVPSSRRVVIVALYLDHVLALNNGNPSPLHDNAVMRWMGAIYSGQPDPGEVHQEVVLQDESRDEGKGELQWEDLAAESREVLVIAARKGEVFELRLHARTLMLEEQGFIERVHELDGFKAGFRIKEKAVLGVKDMRRRRLRGY